MIRHTIEDISKWAERYKYSLSLADVARQFNTTIGTVKRNLIKYKDKFDIEFRDDVQSKLMQDGKRLCVPITGCGETLTLENFQFRNDSGKYKEQCKECRKKYEKKWRQDNKDYMSEYNRAYGQAHREEITKHEQKRLKADVCFKIRKNLRIRLWNAIKNNQKGGSAVKHLGCSVQFLKRHLEERFLPGMSWENYGLYGWHIDHIKPLSSFDLSDLEQIKVACHYTNLQPLWAKDNISKGNK